MLHPVCHHLPTSEATTKAGLRPIDTERPAVLEHADALSAALAPFLAGLAGRYATALAEALGLAKARRKPGGDPQALAAAAERAAAALAALDMREEWLALLSVAEEPLASMARDGAAQALGQLGVTADSVRVLAGDNAMQWARQRAAEMVGMRRTADGLVPNPNARWRIDDSTRDMLQETVERALAEGQSADELAAAIQESTAFSPTRAQTIARTEMAMADMGGAMEGYRASGVVVGKVWSTSHDDRVSAPCLECEAAGVVRLAEEFPTGVQAPPNHPNCRCSVLPILKDEMPPGMKGNGMSIVWGGDARDTLTLGFPITKAEKAPDGRLLIEGIATSEALDCDGEIIDFDSAKAAFGAWAGNIREQHDPRRAVGKAIEVHADDEAKTITVRAFISAGAQDTQAKILDGTLGGFSIGGRIGGRTPVPVKKSDGVTVMAHRVTLSRLSELSVVDAGANPDSGIALVKSVGADGLEAAPGLAGQLDAEPAAPTAKAPAPAPAVEKAGARFSAATKAALKAAHDACRAADKALADLGYEGEPDADDAGKADAVADAADQKRAAEQVSEVAKAMGLEVAEPTPESLAKSAVAALLALRKEHEALKASPATPKGAVRAAAVSKAADRGGEEKEPEPVRKADGSIDQVATLIKAARAGAA